MKFNSQICTTKEQSDLDFHTRGHYVIFEDTEFMESKNIYDNLCDCFQWLIEDNRFNKEYLVDQDVIDEHCKGVLEYLDYIRGEEE